MLELFPKSRWFGLSHCILFGILSIDNDRWKSNRSQIDVGMEWFCLYLIILVRTCDKWIRVYAKHLWCLCDACIRHASLNIYWACMCECSYEHVWGFGKVFWWDYLQRFMRCIHSCMMESAHSIRVFMFYIHSWKKGVWMVYACYLLHSFVEEG